MENSTRYVAPRFFDFSIACKYGLDVSVFVTELNRTISWHANVKTWAESIPDEVQVLPTIVVDGLTYAPFTLADFQREFPWWSSKQIQLIKRNALKVNLICQNHFNVDLRDRTLWYAVKSKLLCI